MDKEKNTRLPLVDLIEVKPMQDGYRWVAITAMLFAIGIILHTVSPNVGGVTPNWTIAMYSIVINLTNPTLSQAVGIGFIAGITLVLERPFGIGDYIVLGDCEGTVEDISFRSTRIRSPDNVAITIENSKITAEYIQNYDRRQSRLWKFTIGLTYDTPREKIEQLTADLTAMLQAQPDVQPDGVTIALDKFKRELHVASRKGLSVLPFQIGFQTVRYRQAVTADPPVGQRRHFRRQIRNPFSLVVLQQQPAEQQASDFLHRHLFTEKRVPGFRLHSTAHIYFSARNGAIRTTVGFFGFFAAAGK